MAAEETESRGRHDPRRGLEETGGTPQKQPPKDGPFTAAPPYGRRRSIFRCHWVRYFNGIGTTTGVERLATAPVRGRRVCRAQHADRRDRFRGPVPGRPARPNRPQGVVEAPHRASRPRGCCRGLAPATRSWRPASRASGKRPAEPPAVQPLAAPGENPSNVSGTARSSSCSASSCSPMYRRISSTRPLRPFALQLGLTDAIEDAALLWTNRPPAQPRHGNIDRSSDCRPSSVECAGPPRVTWLAFIADPGNGQTEPPGFLVVPHGVDDQGDEQHQRPPPTAARTRGEPTDVLCLSVMTIAFHARRRLLHVQRRPRIGASRRHRLIQLDQPDRHPPALLRLRRDRPRAHRIVASRSGICLCQLGREDRASHPPPAGRTRHAAAATAAEGTHSPAARRSRHEGRNNACARSSAGGPNRTVSLQPILEIVHHSGPRSFPAVGEVFSIA